MRSGGAEPANRLPHEWTERDAYVAKLRDEYRADIDLMKLAAELVIDAVIPGDRLRAELIARFDRYRIKRERRPHKKHLVPPV